MMAGAGVTQVVRDKRTGKTKGYGFISFANPTDLVGALKEMNGELWFSHHHPQPQLDMDRRISWYECSVLSKMFILDSGKYVGNRPIKLRKSTWTERTDTDAVGRQKVSHFIIGAVLMDNLAELVQQC